MIEESTISPGFFTTNIDKLSNVDTFDLEIVIIELENDYSKNKFIRDRKFDRSWDNLQGETREVLIDLYQNNNQTEPRKNQPALPKH